MAPPKQRSESPKVNNDAAAAEALAAKMDALTVTPAKADVSLDSGVENSSPEEGKRPPPQPPQVAVALPPITKSSSTSKLKYEYKDDQWSPINTEGKKQYTRDFLMQLQRGPQSMEKPTNLPNMEIIKDNRMKSGGGGGPMGGGGRGGRGDRDRADGRGGPPGKKVIMGLSIQEKIE